MYEWDDHRLHYVRNWILLIKYLITFQQNVNLYFKLNDFFIEVSCKPQLVRYYGLVHSYI